MAIKLFPKRYIGTAKKKNVRGGLISHNAVKGRLPSTHDLYNL